MKRVMCLRLLDWPGHVGGGGRKPTPGKEEAPPNGRSSQTDAPTRSRPRIAFHTVAPTSAKPKATGRKASAEDKDLKFVRELFPSACSGPTVVCVSAEAWAAGVRPGMPLAEARSMAAPVVSGRRNSKSATATETQFLEWAPATDRQALKAVAELTRSFAPIIGVDEMPVPDSLLLDITGCGQLFGGESSLAEQLVRRLNGHQLSCRVAISDSVATAWAFAHPDGHFLQAGHRRTVSGANRRNPQRREVSEWETPVLIIPPGQSESWLHSLPLAAARIPVADAESLFQLGILNIRQLLGLPIEDLPSRISDEAIRRIHQLKGIEDELITPIPEADPVSAVWVSEFAATNRNEVQQVLEHLIDDLAEQLQRRCLGAVKLSSTLTAEDKSSISLTAEMVKPVQSAEEMIEVMKLRLESLRIQKPVFSVKMMASVSPLPVARQRDLFSTSEHVEPTEELAAVINRLSNRLGRDSVLTVAARNDPVPEHNIQWTPVMEAESNSASMAGRLEDLVAADTSPNAASTPANRPLRLLAAPVPIATSGQSPLSDGFICDGGQHAVASFTGPERIQTQWWHETAVHRDYYRILTTKGSQFWIFQDINTRAWLMHGVFE